LAIGNRCSINLARVGDSYLNKAIDYGRWQHSEELLRERRERDS